MTMVICEYWKLVHFADSDEGRLFDLANDPGERRNRWDDAACADKKGELIGRILHWRIQSDQQTQKFCNAFAGTESRLA